MKHPWQPILGRFLQQLQWWLILETWGFLICRLALVLLPLGALAVMVDQRWFGGAHSASITVSIILPLAIIPVGYAFLHRGTSLHQAFEMDERAGLKDRISSAWEFLSQESMTREQELQVRDALRTAHDVDLLSLLTLKDSRLPKWAFAATGVFVASFFVPAGYHAPEADASVDPVRMLQVAEVASLRESLEQMAGEDEALAELVEKLEAVEKQFDEGSIGERDVMIALARLDQELEERMKSLGVEAVNAQFNQVVPHLMASTAAKAVAQAIKENKLDEAAEKLDALGDKLQEDALSPEEKEQLALNMGAAAAKLGKGEKGSLGADFDAASTSMKSDNKDGIESSFKSIQGKLVQCDSLRKMQMASKGLAMTKATLGNKESQLAQVNRHESNRLSDSPSNSAGLGSADPLGAGKRLSDSYREILRVEGMAGDGPVASEVEITEGQTSESGLAARDVYNEYAAVAEQALDEEAVPLSHRFHVKRYFQAIRPEE